MRRALIFAVAIVAIAAAGIVWMTWRSEIPKVPRGAQAKPDAAAAARGRDLVTLGNCQSCHTAPGGADFAGGRGIETPFGTVYSTNITPDYDTGIGSWSDAAFRRALHEGVDREGDHLYPVFPYDHFTKLRDEDVDAIFAYLRTRAPVQAKHRENDLRFPYGFRPLLAGWKLLNFEKGRFTPQANASEKENLGAYLVEGLAHCGSCHTPRNSTGGERREAVFSGGEAEGWHAPALNASASSPTRWSVEQLETYLRNGFVQEHGVAAGPMQEVVNNIGALDPKYASAIAAYMGKFLVAGTRDRPDAKSLLQPAKASFWQASVQSSNPSSANSAGEMIYAGACAMCHESTGLRFSSHGIPLQISKVVAMPDPRNLIHLILHGTDAPDRAPFALMPGFSGSLTDRQVSDLAAFLRSRFSKQPAWGDIASKVMEIRQPEKSSHSEAKGKQP